MDFLKSLWSMIERFIVTLIMIFIMLFSAPGDLFSADVTITFTAPGDALCDTCAFDDTVAVYNVYYSATPFDSTNFKTIAIMQNFCDTPQPPGRPETCILTGLLGGTTYYIGVTSEDARGNESPLSNIITITTPDVTPPQRITDLAASIGG